MPSRRLHLFVQRRRTRCSSTRCARCARWRSRTCSATGWPRSRTRRSACSSGWCSTPRATADFSVYYGTRPRHLRRARPHRAREPVQRRQRHLPRPEQPAGLLAVLHLDARPGVGDARLRRAARVPRDGARRRARRRSADAPRSTASCSRRRRRPATSTSTTRVARTASPTGTPARPGSPRSATGATAPADPFNDHEPVDSSAAAIAAQGLLRLGHHLTARGAGRRSLHAGRPARRRHADRSGRPVSEHRRQPSGPAAALGLSLAERVGPRAGRARACRAASRASGATITCARSRSTCGGWRRTRPT